MLFAAIYLRFGFGLDFVVLSAATSLLLLVAVIDLEHGLILNRIVLPSVAVFLVVAPFWSELGFSRTFPASSGILASAANSLTAGATGFLVFLLIALAYPQGMGGGDVKYAGLLGLLLGIPGVLVALWGAAVSGGLVAIYLLVRRKKGRKDAMPFGPFMSLGGIAVLLAGDDIVAGYQDLIAAARGL
jgi:leader peptidase (prepilin peptidase)/N-methyltransferase